MKMSEFTTKSFLGNAGAAENSYILINYEDSTTTRPVTYKASLQEIGKAIANDQKLYKKTQNGAVTTDVSQGAYVNGAAEAFASTGAVTAAVSGLASTGYVTAAVANAGSGFDPTEAVTCEVYPDPDNSDPQSWSLRPVMIAASTDDIFIYDRGEEGYFPHPLVSNGLMTNAISTAVSGLASTGYVTAAVANAGGNDGFTNDGDIPVYVGASDGSLKWYNWADPTDCTPYAVISTKGKYLVTYDESEGTFGYFADVSSSDMASLPLGETDLHGYIYADSSLAGDYTLKFQPYGEDNPVEVTPAMIGAPSSADLNGLASTGYVTSAISTAVDSLVSAGYVTSAIQTAEMDKVMVDSDKLYYYNSEGSIDAVTIDMISGAATPTNMEYNNNTTLSYLLINGSVDTYYKDETGTWHNVGCPPVFYNAYNDELIDIAGTTISTVPQNTVFYTTDVSNNLFLEDGSGNTLIVFRYNQADDTYTIEAAHN